MRVAVWISGGGTTLLNLLNKMKQGLLDIDVVLVTSSSKEAAGLTFAEEANIETLVVQRKDHATAEEYCTAMFSRCRELNVDYVVMAGFLKHVMIPDDFVNRVVNIHPSLIPAFCGKSMYGANVHHAVVAYGVKKTGCTVHFVDNEFDHGPIILQRHVNISASDDASQVAEKVFEAECEAYPTVLQWLANGRISVVDRSVSIR